MLRKRDVSLNQWLETEDFSSIARFFASDFGKRILQADQVLREIPFTYKLSADDVQTLAMGEKVQQGMLVKGVIDCLVIKDGQGILIDWKTDRGKTAAEFQRDYALQLNLYGLAVQGIMKLPIIKKYIYSLELNQEISGNLRNLLEEGFLSEPDIKRFTEKDFCKDQLGMHLPLLKEVDETRSLKEQRKIKNYDRYYAKPVRVGGKNYLICNHLFDTSKIKYFEWLGTLK